MHTVSQPYTCSLFPTWTLSPTPVFSRPHPHPLTIYTRVSHTDYTSTSSLPLCLSFPSLSLLPLPPSNKLSAAHYNILGERTSADLLGSGEKTKCSPAEVHTTSSAPTSLTRFCWGAGWWELPALPCVGVSPCLGSLAAGSGAVNLSTCSSAPFCSKQQTELELPPLN